MSCVILGAGKIARGFIGHLLYLSGIDFTFVDKNDVLVDLINSQGKYTIELFGNGSCVVQHARAWKFSQREEIIKAIEEADAVFTAVGGKNLPELAPFLADGVKAKMSASSTACLNIVTCENWKNPAGVLREGIESLLSAEEKVYFQTHVGVTEAVIMRSAIEASEEERQRDPLVVKVQDFWELPIDFSRVVGKFPAMQYVKPIYEFTGFLERKFYTYNAANGTVSYLGALFGYEKIADAAHDGRILEILRGVYEETSKALAAKHRFPLDEQIAFTETSRKKLQDYTIVDYIERNARDPLRKLGRDDRLIGSARLVYEYGIVPDCLCTAAAAAIFYENDQDESAVRLKKMREEQGIDYILNTVCGLEQDGAIAGLIKQKVDELKKRGWIRE